ncbi:MAG: amidohydrolase family protein, partial [Gammaproteobacteria bacterium]|nr:amidohydrolase family protein [Gammaproteobacteria bacterium]
MRHALAMLAFCCCIAGCGDTTQDTPSDTIIYDLVLNGGHVIDPESGLDAIRNVGITGGSIAAISTEPMQGSMTIDASDLVVAPGFINLHSHSWTPLGQEFELKDGVTTALELEAGAYPVTEFGTHAPIAIAGAARINFGASVGHAWTRSAVLEADDSVSGADHMRASAITDGDVRGMERPAFREPLTPDQREELRKHLEAGLDEGGLGIGMLLDYMSEVVDEAEMQLVFDAAAEKQAPIIVHIRRGIAGDTSGLLEIIRYAKASGAPVHVCHVQANAMSNIDEFLRLIREARDEGVEITTESFPYNGASTSITAAVFNRDWQTIFDITYEDVEWAATGERFNEEMWHEYREKHPGGTIIHHYNKEEWTSVATNAPDVIVAGDGFPIFTLEQKVAPFGIGTNARVLGRYVREKGSLSLQDAIAKMTYLPAKMLQGYSPSMAMKGRIKIGAD